MMLHFFSSKYIVAALAMMAMTMTYNINNSNGVVNAEDACKAIDGNLQLCTSGSCTCGEYDCPADHICGNCEDDVSPCSASSVSSASSSSGDVASGDVASGTLDVGGALAECYSCTFTGKLCAVPFTECTGSSTPCEESYTGTLSSAQCAKDAVDASGDVSGDGDDDDDDDNDGASADAETNVVAGAEASAQTAQEDGEAAMNEDNMDSINDTEAAAEADASTTEAAAETAGSTTEAAAETAGSTTASAASEAGEENAEQSEIEGTMDSVSDASTTATDAVNTAATTATDAVNNSVKVEVSSAALLSSSMMGIAAVTTVFVAIA